MNLTTAERKKLKTLRDEADQFYEDQNALKAEASRLNKIATKLFGPDGAFEKFWAPIRKRESGE